MSWLGAQELVNQQAKDTLTAVAIMQATYARIEAINPQINAIVSLLDNKDALALAAAADEHRERGEPLGLLHGIPMAVKDLEEAEGFPTTFGFRPFANRIATRDGLVTTRQKAAGAIVIGKTNTPEFGLGSHTFNAVFGATCNPYDLTKSAGGSSGGAAAALAAGLLTVADGSDMGGSLRNPAAFCNVVGLRPSIGRVPDTRELAWFGRLGTSGPMARTVSDVARLLAVQAGPHTADPLCLDTPGDRFADPTPVSSTKKAPLKIAWTTDLGFMPVVPQVAAAIHDAVTTFNDLGYVTEAAHPDLSFAMPIFQTQRAAGLANLGRNLDRAVPDWRSYAKDTALWNIDEGATLSSETLVTSEVQRTLLYREVVTFFEQYDALILPSAQVLPFDLETDWVRSINGQSMPTYLDWMTTCCAVSVTGLPAISVPGGFSDDGLPIGIQIVGKPRGDLGLLRVALAFEQATGYAQTHPTITDGIGG